MITQKEYELLKHYHTTGCRWITRDKNYDLYAFNVMPTKFISFWAVESGFSLPCLVGECGDNIFTYVKWEDEKPTKILDLIQDYESHQTITEKNTLNNFFGTDNFNIRYVPQFKNLLYSLKKDVEYLENKSSCEHRSKQGKTNMSKTELIKEIEDILGDIGIRDYQHGECHEGNIWSISAMTIREIFSAIEKYSLDDVKATVPAYKYCFHCGGKLIDG